MQPMEYEPVIGLEIHAELNTSTKMFCGCKNDPLEHHPNVNICPVCMAHPGTLPVINRDAVEKVIRVGLALGGEISPYSQFDRKNYFYPDLPKGYQISQYKYPIVLGGSLRGVRITRVHLEEDTGRLQHIDGGPASGAGQPATLVDYNRVGVPLMELVSEPDIRTATDARAFADELQRQEEALRQGEKIKQDTRGWDDINQCTVSQRSKESAHDYRYLPEPDLPPLNLTSAGGFDIETMRNRLPELPMAKRERFSKQYGLPSKIISFLVSDKHLADYFEQASSELASWIGENKEAEFQKASAILANYMSSDLQSLLVAKDAQITDIRITPENFAELVKMIYTNEISSRAAKDVLARMFADGSDPSDIVQEDNLRQISNVSALDETVKKIIQENPKPVEDYKKGKTVALQMLIGKVMKETNGVANPEVVREVLTKLL